MITELQRRYCRSKFFRRNMLAAIAAETACIKGYKRLWYDSFVTAFERQPEAQIKAQLYSFLQCDDLEPADRAEILQLLQLSGTTLTERQRRQITTFLQG